ncbi:hypothetical protein P7M41_26515 [Vibrio parahaemolyticus]|nr:hypothetical protein [Vibrio parahaemolyticus]
MKSGKKKDSFSANELRHFRDVWQSKMTAGCFHQQGKFKVDIKGM